MALLDRAHMAVDSKERIDQWDTDHSWHPFTPMKEYLEFPITQLQRAEGCWIYDTEGNRYLDGNASNWSKVHGHNDPDLNAALVEQMNHMAHVSYKGLGHPTAAKLCEQLARLTPEGLTRSFFTDNGSCAIETALKLSFQYWQMNGRETKREVIAIRNGYHGDTIGSMSVGDAGGFHNRFSQWMFDKHVIPAPVCHEYAGKVSFQDDSESIQTLTQLLQERSEHIALLTMEPWILGPGGLKLHPKGFLKKVRALCDEYDVHLILDEIFVGFGRMGPMFVCGAEDVCPDFLCLSKGLNGGYLPFAATVTTEKMYQAFLGDFAEMKTFFHGHTFAANALCTAVSVKSIEKLEAMIASGAIDRRIQTFEQKILEHLEGHPYISEIRQRGLACGIDISRGAGKPDFTVDDRIGFKFYLDALKNGLLLRPIGNTIYMIPSLIMNEEEMDQLCKQTAASIRTVVENA